MTAIDARFSRGILAIAILCIVSMLTGCDGLWKNSPAYFQPNLVQVAVAEKISPEDHVTASRLETSSVAVRDIATVLEAMFGTPDRPFVVTLAEAEKPPLDMAKLRRAAGPVWSDEDANTGGLFRQHCVHCHGVTGGGDGPTARTLNPYPRDFRRGVFKFKSTELNAKPTDADLRRVLYNGIPGTAMPSFKLLRGDELDALVEYVKYLSMRGETELKLIDQVIGTDEPIDNSRDNLLSDENFGEIVTAWSEANDAVVTPKTIQPEDFAGKELENSITRGRALFYGTGNCFSCHGPSARGDGTLDASDIWNEKIGKDWTAIGALPKRFIRPRNLREGVFRGGRRPIDIYRRIYAGINGAGMPGSAASLVKGDDDQAIWDLVNYVRHLPFEVDETKTDQDGEHRVGKN